MEKTYSPISEITWDDLRHRLFTPEELEASDIRVAIIGELIHARQHGITIKDIAKKTGLKKSKIKKLMAWDKKTEFDTVVAVLLALWKTIMVTDFRPDGQTEKNAR